jgi:hypothetical protein
MLNFIMKSFANSSTSTMVWVAQHECTWPNWLIAPAGASKVMSLLMDLANVLSCSQTENDKSRIAQNFLDT